MKKQFTIVLTDDDEDENLFFQEAIDSLQQDLSLITFDNGAALLKWLNEGSGMPDVIFLDINMPVLNGFEVLQALRKMQQFSEVPVVIYSTSTSALDMKQAYSFGADLYLCKIIAIRDLPAKLNLIIDGIKNKRPLPLQEFAITAF